MVSRPRKNLDITIHYFDVYNRAEPARMLLTHAGVSFKDNRFQMEDWSELKPTMPGGVVPAIEFKDGNQVKKLGQTGSLTRFLGRTYGYYPADPL